MTKVAFYVTVLAVFAVDFGHAGFFAARSVEAVFFGQRTNNYLVSLGNRSI